MDLEMHKTVETHLITLQLVNEEFAEKSLDETFFI